ncbi:TetR/AcrR family transcriptional regulator [Mycobacterium sp. BMJ-28]
MSGERIGRPRDPAKDELVRIAVRKLLVDKGFAATTIPAVAREAGVGAPTIYRRWSTQVDLVESALGYVGPPLDFGADGDFHASLGKLVRAVVDYFTDPVTRAALPGLIANYDRDSARYARVVHQGEDPLRQQFQIAHAQAVAKNAIPARPSADAIFDTVIGLSMYHGVWRHTVQPESPEELTNTVIEIVEAAIRPEIAPPSPTARRRRN